MKRMKIKPKKPNPLFELWLEEWRKESESKNSELQYHFSKALASLKKFPLPLKSGKDCIILQHFGKKLCLMLDKKLEKYKAENDSLTDAEDFVCIHCNYNEKHVSNKMCKSQQITTNVDNEHLRTELAVFNELNLSLWNLENYAVILILYKNAQNPCYPGFTDEVELLLEMKKLCDHGSKVAIKNLFDNGLISATGVPIRYSLTEHGVNIAKKLCEITTIDVKLINSSDVLIEIETRLKSLFRQNLMLNKNTKNLNKKDTNVEIIKDCYENTHNNLSKFSQILDSQTAEFISSEKNIQESGECSIKQKPKENKIDIKKCHKQSKKVKNVEEYTLNKAEDGKTEFADNLQKNIYLEANKFDIILLVDTQEICGGKTKPQHDATIMELSQLSILFEVRNLKIGDFAWIARCRVTSSELILPYIVERKRIDDLSASITDGRFHEQKFRLKQCGIENLMYIIEEYGKNQRLTIPHSTLIQASINTLIQDGFLVKYTENHKSSMFYLSSLTKILIKIFKGKNLIGCKKEALAQTNIVNNTLSLMEFEEFNKAASKQKVFNVSQMFIRQLLQLKGISIDKAFAIVERYPTPRILFDTLQNSDCSGDSLLSSIEFGDKKRLLGASISKTIYQLYTMKNLN